MTGKTGNVKNDHNRARREFIKSAALTVGATGSLAASGLTAAQAANKASGLPLSIMVNAAWFKDSLPWFGQEFAETRSLMGDNYYSYGIKPNRKALETLFRYSQQQGLCSRALTIEELFEPASLELTET